MGMEEQKKCSLSWCIARKTGTPIVATNDVHFLKRRVTMTCMMRSSASAPTKNWPSKRMRYSTEVYLKSPEEMRKVFKDYPDALGKHAEKSQSAVMS